jgi:hypothetical protein
MHRDLSWRSSSKKPSNYANPFEKIDNVVNTFREKYKKEEEELK